MFEITLPRLLVRIISCPSFELVRTDLPSGDFPRLVTRPNSSSSSSPDSAEAPWTRFFSRDSRLALIASLERRLRGVRTPSVEPAVASSGTGAVTGADSVCMRRGGACLMYGF